MSLVGLMAVAAAAQTPGVTASVAVAYTNATGQTINIPGTFYRSTAGNTREDSAIGSVITDKTAGTVTVLNPSTMTATVYSFHTGPLPRAMTPSITPSPLTQFGQTTVGGHPVAQARASWPNGQAPEVWTATDINLVVYSKVSSANGTTTRTLSNIVVQEPSASVFNVPAGYSVTNATQPPALPAVPTGHSSLIPSTILPTQ